MSSKFQDLFLSRQSEAGAPKTTAGRLVANINRKMEQEAGGSSSFVERDVATAFVSMESLDNVKITSLREAGSFLEQQINDIISTESLESGLKVSEAFTANQMASAMFAGLMGTTADRALKMKAPSPSLEANQVFIDYSGQGDYLGTRIRPAVESYDERDNRHATAYSIAYNMLTTRQDEFGEALFPTVVVSPDQVGFVMSIRLVNVMDDIRHDVKGTLADFNKRNIIHAVIDASILENDSTAIIPVHSVDSASFFVSGVTPYAVDYSGESVNTAPLAFGKSVDLMGISQTAKLLDTGILDVTDAIDSSIVLQTVAIKIEGSADDVIEINTSSIPLSVFHDARQGHYRTMRLAFDPQYVIVKGPVKLADRTGNSTDLAALETSKHVVRLKLSVFGSVNQETGETSLTANGVTVVAVYDEDGNKLSITSGPGKTTADLFAGATPVGYTLRANRTNSNRRQRGQLLTTDYYQQIYAVPLHAPITTLRPVTVSDQTDAADLAALVTATHIRTSNAAVTKLLEAVGTLRDYVQNGQVVNQNPEMLGIANWLVKAFFYEETVEVEDIVDSLKSADRMADLQAAIVSKVRHFAYTAYRDTGYKAAADALAGGIAPKPTVIIATDPVIANYLLVNGDFRTLGNDFDVKIVSSLDTRVYGKMFVTFGQFGEGKEGQPNPMHFGNMGWKPELTIVLPMTRNGQISKELTVQPAFVHVVNLPVLGVFTVNGIEKVIDAKVNVNTAEQNQSNGLVQVTNLSGFTKYTP